MAVAKRPSGGDMGKREPPRRRSDSRRGRRESREFATAKGLGFHLNNCFCGLDRLPHERRPFLAAASVALVISVSQFLEVPLHAAPAPYESHRKH